jgi:hypothetical protein
MCKSIRSDQVGRHQNPLKVITLTNFLVYPATNGSSTFNFPILYI